MAKLYNESEGGYRPERFKDTTLRPGEFKDAVDFFPGGKPEKPTTKTQFETGGENLLDRVYTTVHEFFTVKGSPDRRKEIYRRRTLAAFLAGAAILAGTQYSSRGEKPVGDGNPNPEAPSTPVKQPERGTIVDSQGQAKEIEFDTTAAEEQKKTMIEAQKITPDFAEDLDREPLPDGRYKVEGNQK
ncbi:MAG: hypothetical protein M1355_02680 [Patescibacteria group bacterium]|nr:hypothetical protein [Patescibacteria group bacterium]